MIEFKFGDRVKLADDKHEYFGSVVNEQLLASVNGSFEDALPLPVAVRWDTLNECWWTPGERLELA